jgi:hypothetical protein
MKAGFILITLKSEPVWKLVATSEILRIEGSRDGTGVEIELKNGKILRGERNINDVLMDICAANVWTG